jgi:hypothetical protein
MKKGSLKSQMKKIIECKTLIDLEKREPLKCETMKAPSAQNIEKSLKNEENFRGRRWRSSLQCLRTLDLLLCPHQQQRKFSLHAPGRGAKLLKGGLFCVS